MDTKRLLKFLLSARSQGYDDDQITEFILSKSSGNNQSQDNSQSQKTNIPSDFINLLSGNIPITQQFGQKSPYDVFSGGINTGVDFAVGEGSPVKTPEGDWLVDEVAGGVSGRGYIGNSANQGYGNTVIIKNLSTGEKIRTSHLSQIKVKKGQKVKNGEVLGLSGATGNVTGPHLDAEYYNQSGILADILKTAYGKEIL